MLRDLIKHFVSCFPTRGLDYAHQQKDGAVGLTGSDNVIEPSIEYVIATTKQKLKAELEKECKKVTKRVVKADVRKELFAKYGMDEQKELDEYCDSYCRGLRTQDFSGYMEARLVECIVEEMTQEVLLYA
jgi:hypothetical protein